MTLNNYETDIIAMKRGDTYTVIQSGPKIEYGRFDHAIASPLLKI